MTKKNRKEFNRYFWIGLIVLVILWQALERVTYGEVQPRMVDDIMTAVFMAFAGGAYFLGKKHGADESMYM